ncbi:MAG: YihY/virulence factor BrkB family protein [Candidatus Competibacteraceae bacterium]|nr:YihY/virulence factor BrkB family protein [Candidatus Competibacteraceae bacterium]
MRLRDRIISYLPIEQTLKLLNKIVLPGFGGIPLGEIVRFYVLGLQKSSLTTRSAAVSFRFFMALFPGLIFLITLIPYIPIADFPYKLMLGIQEILPQEVFPLFEKTIIDALHNRKTGLLSLGFLAAVFFATNGMNALMQAFNDSAYVTETRTMFRHRLVAFVLTLFAVLVFVSGIFFLVYSNRMLAGWLRTEQISHLLFSILSFMQWVVLAIVIYFYVATIFYFAPSRSMRWTYFSVGALVSTLFSMLFSYLTSVYMNNFSNYNQIFGLLGSFPIILIWMYLNSISLLIGFELNVSIRHAGFKKIK